MRYAASCCIGLMLFIACNNPDHTAYIMQPDRTGSRDTLLPAAPDSAGFVTHIATAGVTPAQVVAFAESLKGVPYRYGSTDPARERPLSPPPPDRRPF